MHAAACSYYPSGATEEEMMAIERINRFAFIDGASFALSHQWVSVEETLPELRERVLICEKVANQYKIFIGKRVSFNDGWEWNQSTKESVVAWMPLPKYNPELLG